MFSELVALSLLSFEVPFAHCRSTGHGLLERETRELFAAVSFQDTQWVIGWWLRIYSCVFMKTALRVLKSQILKAKPIVCVWSFAKQKMLSQLPWAIRLPRALAWSRLPSGRWRLVQHARSSCHFRIWLQPGKKRGVTLQIELGEINGAVVCNYTRLSHLLTGHLQGQILFFFLKITHHNEMLR